MIVICAIILIFVIIRLIYNLFITPKRKKKVETKSDGSIIVYESQKDGHYIAHYDSINDYKSSDDYQGSSSFFSGFGGGIFGGGGASGSFDSGGFDSSGSDSGGGCDGGGD